MSIIKILAPTLFCFSRVRLFYPLLTFRRNSGAYEGIAKTHAIIANKRSSDVKMIDAYSQEGFRLTDDSFVYGPMLIFKNHVFCWNVASDEDINEESLEFFFHIIPPVDLLVIGYSKEESRPKLNKNLHVITRKNNIFLEILPTVKACSTYNLLAEMRNVAGAFLPPFKYQFTETDQYLYKCRIMKWEDPDGLDEEELKLLGKK